MRSDAMRSASSHSAIGRNSDGTVSQNTVTSSVVYASACPPTPLTSVVCCPGWTFFDPVNIRRSRRCAQPLRPGVSSFDPTWYHTWMLTIGVE